MYVIKKGSLYVARTGHKSSYTNRIEYAAIYRTEKAAQANRCIENESVVHISAHLNS